MGRHVSRRDALAVVDDERLNVERQKLASTSFLALNPRLVVEESVTLEHRHRRHRLRELLLS